ncbi:hypothetical protein IFR05_004522 [Cadophora sp. M221]|nr:hypothetical protein IFR05_004522 [Cadophora sp. M221]
MDGPACPARGPAMKYISEVQKRFSADPTVYQQFLKIVMDSQNDPSKESTAEAEQKVKLLFNNHPDLVEGFKQFLPAETAQPKQEETFQTPDSERQQQLLKVFAEYNEKPTSLDELSSKLKELFGEDPAMLKMLDQYTTASKGGQK